MEVRDDQYGFYYWLMRYCGQHDSFSVIIDQMTKSAHFLLVKTTFSAEDYAIFYIQAVVRIHGVVMSINSYRGAQFWKSFKKGLDSKVNLITTFNYQTDGLEERTIQNFEGYFEAVCDRFQR